MAAPTSATRGGVARCGCRARGRRARRTRRRTSRKTSTKTILKSVGAFRRHSESQPARGRTGWRPRRARDRQVRSARHGPNAAPGRRSPRPRRARDRCLRVSAVRLRAPGAPRDPGAEPGPAPHPRPSKAAVAKAEAAVGRASADVPGEAGPDATSQCFRRPLPPPPGRGLPPLLGGRQLHARLTGLYDARLLGGESRQPVARSLERRGLVDAGERRAGPGRGRGARRGRPRAADGLLREPLGHPLASRRTLRARAVASPSKIAPLL